MKNNRVLVCGGAGYIGGMTCDALIRAGFEVSVYDNLLYEDRFLKNVRFISGDIRDTKKVLEVSNDHDIIVLLSALVGDPACNVDESLTLEINYEAIKNICEALPSDKYLVFASTCSVYGAQNTLLNEQSQTDPLSLYAYSKLRAEKHVLDRNGVIFRLGTVFGLGDTYSRLRLDLVVNVLTMKAITTGEITIYGGEQWRPIIANRDISQYILEACTKKPKGLYVISKENVLISELGKSIVKLIPNTKINYVEIPFQDSRNYRVDNSKALRDFEYKPETTVEEEVNKMIKVFTENRVKDLSDIVYHNGEYLKNKKQKKSFV